VNRHFAVSQSGSLHRGFGSVSAARCEAAARAAGGGVTGSRGGGRPVTRPPQDGGPPVWRGHLSARGLDLGLRFLLVSPVSDGLEACEIL